MSLKVVVNKTTNKVEVTSPGPQGTFYNSYKGTWSSATAYFVGDIVFYNGSSYVATVNNTNSQPPSASWAAVARGIPGGGTSGQIIVKNSSTDYDYSWTNNYSIATTSPLTGGAAINTNPTLAINSTSDDTANYVVQRDANQSFSIGAVRFDTSSVQTSAVGKLYWDGNETLNLGLGSTGTVTIAIGQEVINYVTNAEATTLNVGEVVYLFGAQGDRPSVKRASNASDATSAKTFGIVAEAITAGGAGFVINKGIVSKVNTSAYAPGDILWLGSTPGTFTTTKPVAPAHLVFVGVVLRTNAGNGLVYVSPQNGYELEEIHDVLITSKTNGDFLVYESATDLWKNKQVTATAPITYDAATRVIAATAATTAASGVVQLTDSTSSTSTTTAATPNSVKSAYDLAAAAIPLTQKAAANGVATLGSDGLVPTNQLPALAITNTFVVASQAAMLALTAETGDVAVRTDVNKSFILTATPASTLANWQELLTPPDAVSSVDGRTGTVTLTDKYAQLAAANTFTTSPQQINGAASAIGLIIRANATTPGNLQEWQNSGGTAIASVNASGFGTFGNLVVTSSTVPANGIYLPAANTLGLATNGAVAFQINSTGNIGFPTPSTGFTLLVGKNPTGAATTYQITAAGVAQSDVSTHHSFYSAPNSQATAYTLGTLHHFRATGVGIGAGSTVLGQNGFFIDSAFTTATNNYGFRSILAAASGRWNIYFDGTAANYFAGQTTVGSTSLTLGAPTSSVAQQFGIVSAAASNVVEVIRGAAAQTGNLTEWQNSAGSVLSFVNSIGSIRIGTTATGNAFAVSTANAGAASLGILVRGTTSQTADLQQFQDVNGNVLSSINAAGTFVGNVQDSQLIQYGAEGSLLQNVPTRVHPAETLLKQAVWWIDAAHSASSGQTITNLGWGGSALNVTNGSSASSDSNDAQYLAWDGTNYVYLPGIAGNNLTIPDSNALDITGDIDIRCQVAMDDWTPSAATALVGKWNSAGTSRAYLLALTTTGGLQLYWSADGSNALVASSSANVSFIDGNVGWVRATLDVNNGASGRDVQFFTSTDGINWTQLGTTQTSAGVTSIFANTQDVAIGVQSVNQWSLAGKIYRAQILNGIDGTPVLDVDTSQISSGAATSFTALTGQTVTINRSTSGRKTVAVTHPVWLFGTDDYMEVNNRWLEHTGTNYLYLPGVVSNYASTPDSAALDITGDIDLRVKVAMDDWTPSGTGGLIIKYQNNTNYSYGLYLNTNGTLTFTWSPTGALANAIYVNSIATGITDGATKWVRATLDVDNGASGNDVKFFLSDDGTNWTQLGSTVTSAGTTSIFSSASVLEVGSFGAGTYFMSRGKFFRAQVLNGIGGTVAFDANFETGITTNLPTTFTESSANAATVTVNYSGTGYRSAGVIASTYVFPGNPNTFKLSNYSFLDFGASDSFTVLLAHKLWNNPSLNGGLIMKRSSLSSLGYGIASSGTTPSTLTRIGDGTNEALPYPPGSSSGAQQVTAVVFNRSNNTGVGYTNGTAGTSVSISSIGNTSNFETLQIGRYSNGLAINDLEFVGAAIFRRVLTASEIATLSSYYAGRIA